MPNGKLRRYNGRCGNPYTPGSGHTSPGTGWNAYDVLTVPGDLTGGGKAGNVERRHGRRSPGAPRSIGFPP
ncbi:hypothetical protein [Streptomyces sp. NPDC002559]